MWLVWILLIPIIIGYIIFCEISSARTIRQTEKHYTIMIEHLIETFETFQKEPKRTKKD